VRSPNIDYREMIEHNFSATTFDKRADKRSKAEPMDTVSYAGKRDTG
jgi:hypothetical protein